MHSRDESSLTKGTRESSSGELYQPNEIKVHVITLRNKCRKGKEFSGHNNRKCQVNGIPFRTLFTNYA